MGPKIKTKQPNRVQTRTHTTKHLDKMPFSGYNLKVHSKIISLWDIILVEQQQLIKKTFEIFQKTVVVLVWKCTVGIYFGDLTGFNGCVDATLHDQLRIYSICKYQLLLHFQYLHVKFITFIGGRTDFTYFLF